MPFREIHGSIPAVPAVCALLGLFFLDGCSHAPDSKGQPAAAAPANAVPAGVQAALDSNFQTWSAQGKLGVKIPKTGYQDLAVGKDGSLTVSDQGEVVVKSDIVIGPYRLAAGTTLKKRGAWWTVDKPGVPDSIASEVPKESKFEGYLSTGNHLATGAEIILFLDPASRAIPDQDLTKPTASPVLAVVTANSAELSTSLDACLFFASNAAPVDGKPPKEMIHIAVFPSRSMGVPKNHFVTGRVATHTPGSIYRLPDVVQKFGEATEKQTWSAKMPMALGIDGTVHWWGNVGVLASRDGRITHVLLRGRPKA